MDRLLACVLGTEEMNYEEEQHLVIPEEDDQQNDDFEPADTYGYYESFRGRGRYLNPNRDLFND